MGLKSRWVQSGVVLQRDDCRTEQTLSLSMEVSKQSESHGNEGEGKIRKREKKGNEFVKKKQVELEN